MKKHDAIVVGAGNGGLTCAAWLAKEGKSVLLVERHNLPGGFATSFKRGRFEFEASLHELCGWGKKPGEGSVRRIFEHIGVAGKIEMCDIPSAYRVITMNDDENMDATMPFGIEAYIDKMEEYVPGSRPSVEHFFALCADIVKTTDFMGELGGKFNASALKAIRDEHMNFVRVAGYSVNEVFDALEMPQKARDILSAYWSYLGEPLNELSFIHYASMVLTYIDTGAVIPKNRSHGMSSAILDSFEEMGGEVWLNSPVEKIIMYRGAAKGIVLADGTRAYADHIVCNCSPHSVFSTMIDKMNVPEAELKRANAREIGARGFSMFLGLNKSPEALGIKDHCWFLYDTADTVKQYQLMKRIETNDVQATVCLNMADPDCSPEGTTILYFTALYTDNCWSAVSAKNYVKTKQDVAERMISNFEKYTGVKIRDSIEEIEIATPMTYARYTGVPQGAIYGYRTGTWDGIVPRIMMEKTDEKIPGLRFAGGFSSMHNGYSSAYTSGMKAALKTLDDMKRFERSGQNG